MEPLILSHLEDAESGWWVRILKDVQYNRRSVSSSSLSRTNTRASAQGAGERRLCAAAHNKMWNLRSIPYVSGAVHGARQTLSIHAFSPLQSITAVITVSATMRPTFTKKFNGSVWHTKPIHQQIYRASQSAASWSVAHHRCYCSGSMRMKECWTQMSFFFEDGLLELNMSDVSERSLWTSMKDIATTEGQAINDLKKEENYGKLDVKWIQIYNCRKSVIDHSNLIWLDHKCALLSTEFEWNIAQNIIHFNTIIVFSVVSSIWL